MRRCATSAPPRSMRRGRGTSSSWSSRPAATREAGAASSAAPAQVKGIAGVIAEGPVRDVDEAREIGFPIFCRSFTAFTARARVHEAATDVPVGSATWRSSPG
ncbi:MAG: hypothetical protein WDN24_12090 [Sphingomonas sp.]